MAHRPLVGPEEAEGPAPLLAERRPAPPELGGGRVVEGDAAVGICGVDRDPERVEEPAIDGGAAPCRTFGLLRRRLATRDDPEQVAVVTEGRGVGGRNGRLGRDGRWPSLGAKGHANLTGWVCRGVYAA